MHKQLRKCKQVYDYVSCYVSNQLQQLKNIDYYLTVDGMEVYIDAENYRDVLGLQGIRSNEELAIDILNRVNLAVKPGTSFGEKTNKLRFSLKLVDFDGNQALQGLEQEPVLTENEFIQRYGKVIKETFDLLRDYFEIIKG